MPAGVTRQAGTTDTLAMKRNRLSESFREHGQAIVEFALAVPFLLAFILFMVDCGLLAFSYVSAANAVREGARCAVVGGTSAAVQSRVTGTYGGIAIINSVDAPVYTPSPAAIGGGVTVTAHLTYAWITPVGWVPGLTNISWNPKATMRMETSSIAKNPCS